MTNYSQKLRERLLDLGWSLWTGLGVPGTLDNHGDHAIDIEPLIVFTAALGDTDPRLRDEATDWCIRYGSLVSGARLKNMLGRESDSVQASFGEIAATVAEHSSLRWPKRTNARNHTPRKRPKIQVFDRASQIALRLRAWLGVGARAEIIRAFLAQPQATYNAADLAFKIDYSKRNVAQVLEALRLGDVVRAVPVRNQLKYSLPHHRLVQFQEQLKPVPEKFMQWSSILHVLTTSMVVVEQTEAKRATVRAVEARAVVEKLAQPIRETQLPPPNTSARGSDFWDEFIGWVMGLADR